MKQKHNFKHFYQQAITALAAFMLVMVSMPVYAEEKAGNENGYEKYVAIDNHNMRVVLYGDITQNESGISFSDDTKSTVVMLPGMGVPSPNLYFKPLAQELDDTYNVIIVEPFGYGLSDQTSTDRSVENINGDLNKALNALEVDECILLVHSISGVYGLNFVNDYPDKVKGFIAIDNTVYDDGLIEALTMEKNYMLNEIEKFNKIRNSFDSISDFRLAIANDPEKYGAELPDIQGYSYTKEDKDEYISAYSLSSNDTIKSEVNNMNKSLATINGEKFPDTLPVLMMLSSDNVENVPAWETGHRNQINPASGNHDLSILKGSHYIWYTNLSGVVEQINKWTIKNQF